MQTKKYLSLLGIARRAGKLSMGHDAALDSLRRKKARLIVFSGDVSENTVRDFEKIESSVPAVKIPDTMQELEKALGRGTKVLTVNEQGFAGRIAELINQEEIAYGNKD